MVKLYTNSEVKISSISYQGNTKNIQYVFVVDGTEFHLSGKMHEDPDIRGVSYTDELDAFVMLIMPFYPEISKKIFALSWEYVDGKNIEFPITLMPLTQNKCLR